MAKAVRGLPQVLTGILLIAVLFTAYTAQRADATHEPAMKTGAAGSDVNEIQPEGEKIIMRDRVRVSTAQDLVLSVTSECSILTSLITGDNETDVGDRARDTASAFGQVEIFVELDGKRVPVASDDTEGPDTDDPEEEVETDEDEEGEVVFCNRAYQRTVEDRSEAGNDEGPDEGDIDIERDYIRTRTANAFNWLAGNVGDDQTNCTAVDPDQYCFDDVALNGNNIIDIVVWAEYDVNPNTSGNDPANCPTTPGMEITCAAAFVGSRTLIADPVHIAIHEVVGETDGEGN